jgi:Uma2 family endonuclease
MGESTLVRLPVRSGLKVSQRAFWALCATNPELRMTRTSRGELIVMPPAGSETGFRNAGLTGQLWAWNEANGLGVAFDSSAGFTFPNGLVHAPDASWIRQERWDRLTRQQKERFAPICPDFAAELLSPSDRNRKADVHALLEEYIAQGVRLGWLIDPEHAEVEIHRPGRPVEILKRPATLSGEDVLPGFVLDLKGILFD